MQNIAEFRIIGRVGSVDTTDKVTHVSVAVRRRGAPSRSCSAHRGGAGGKRYMSLDMGAAAQSRLKRFEASHGKRMGSAVEGRQGVRGKRVRVSAGDGGE